ncbi:MAG: hypothetical protein SAK29_34040 [Scytonema sp. PMC 1069.18]|nr:hypothetical protein [Scytonema sp. PMC 1069.18]
MTQLRILEAYEFYRKFIYNEELINLLREYNIRIPGSISPQLWELFGAILTGDKGTGTYGADLSNYEVKSSIDGNSFEYQYHLRTGRDKLLKDMTVDHLFVSYSRDYRNVTVRQLGGNFHLRNFPRVGYLAWKNAMALKNLIDDTAKISATVQ